MVCVAHRLQCETLHFPKHKFHAKHKTHPKSTEHKFMYISQASTIYIICSKSQSCITVCYSFDLNILC